MKPKDQSIEGDGYYAIVEDGKIWIPTIDGDMGRILRELHNKTGIKNMIFSAVQNPKEFKTHLKNILREWDDWFSDTHCIEIEFKEKSR